MIDNIFESFVLIVFGKNNSCRKYPQAVLSVLLRFFPDNTADIQFLKNMLEKLNCVPMCPEQR